MSRTTRAHALAFEPSGAGTAGRDALFLVFYLLSCIGATPFVDLSKEATLDPAVSGNLIGQLSMIAMTLALGAFLVATRQLFVLRYAITPVLVATLAWFALSVVYSNHADIASRRLVLGAMMIFQAIALLAIPMTKRDLARLLGLGTLIVLLISFAGILLVPDLAIHQAYEVREPELAGDWRGPFGHKNGAAAVMAMFIFIGYYASRQWNVAAGRLIMALSIVFLFFTHSKASMALTAVTALTGWMIVNARPAGKIFLTLLLPAFLALITIGSLTLSPVRDALGSLSIDASFTGRNVIWDYALTKIAERPYVGHGFQAFWSMPELLYNWTPDSPWGMRATDAHNGYLNVAVMTGYVGLTLTLLWAIVQPLRDLIKTERADFDPALTLLFVQILQFGYANAAFESVLFLGGSTVWFLMIVSVVGLGLQRAGVLRGA